MGYYDTSLVCRNGHVITDMVSRSDKADQKFCDRCGAATLGKCEGCGQGVRGDYYNPSVLDLTGHITPAPAYCHSCGRPFPWTEARFSAARELADDLASDISAADVDTLKKSVEQVSSENPMAEVGATRAKRILDRLGDSATARALYRVFVDVASETAAKVFKPGP